jgi:hypothetical protein
MPQIKVYHSPHFLEYRGRHSDIAPPVRPVATVQVPAELSAEQSLEIAYRQTQHVSRPWWDNDDVLLHVRSTSVGDMLADEQGNLFVVESVGFQTYQPRAVRPHHWLAAAYRQLDAVLGQADTRQIMTAASQTRNTILHVLESEGYLNGEVPILAWDDSQSGDLVGDPNTGLFRVIARKLRPKWRAKRLLAHIPGAQIWIDSPRTWAVLVPVNEESEI